MGTGVDALAIKGGAVVLGGSLAAELIIFSDPLYFYLAIAGALVSMFGVLHESIQSTPEKRLMVALEAVKGVLLAFIATPMWFIMSINIGDLLVLRGLELLLDKENIEGFTGISNSVWFLLSLILSWWTIPIITWFKDQVILRRKGVTNERV